MAEALVVVGAGGFARETLDVLTALERDGRDRWDLLGVLDDSPSQQNLERLDAMGVRYLGAAVPQSLPSGRTSVVVAVGSPGARVALWRRFRDSPARMAATLVHPRAEVGSRCRIGAGSVVCAGVVVGTNVTVGVAVHLNPNVTVGHDTVLDDFVSVNPAATVSGECVLGREVLVGAASVILQGLTVSPGALVGAGAVVVRDVPAGTTVKGVPAR